MEYARQSRPNAAWPTTNTGERKNYLILYFLGLSYFTWEMISLGES